MHVFSHINVGAARKLVFNSYSGDYVDFESRPLPPSQSAPAPPDTHEPPVLSESSSSSFTDEATPAQFAPPGKLRVPSASIVGNVTVPGSYLHSAFIVQSSSREDDVWIADSGAPCHITHDRTSLYNVRPPPPGRETITIGDRRKIKVEYVGNVDVIFRGKADRRITLIDVAYVPGLGFLSILAACRPENTPDISPRRPSGKAGNLHTC